MFKASGIVRLCENLVSFLFYKKKYFLVLVAEIKLKNMNWSNVKPRK